MYRTSTRLEKSMDVPSVTARGKLVTGSVNGLHRLAYREFSYHSVYLLDILNVAESSLQEEFRLIRKFRPHAFGYRGLWSVFGSSTAENSDHHGKCLPTWGVMEGGSMRMLKLALYPSLWTGASLRSCWHISLRRATIGNASLSSWTHELYQHHPKSLPEPLGIQRDNAPGLFECCEARQQSTGNDAWGIWSHGNR